MVLPLSGIKVVELTRDISGPYCGMALADMGAEVTKVESPKAVSRDGGPLWKAAKFVAYNRNKKSVAVDLESDEGRMVTAKLIKTSDVFLENLAPGAADRLGFSYKRVSKLNPKIIYCSIKYYLPGPYGDRDVDDAIVETEAGFQQQMGNEEPAEPLNVESPPLKLGVPISALGAGEFAALAIAGALLSRMKTGTGEYINVGHFETAYCLLSSSDYSLRKEKRKHTAVNYKLKDGEWIQGSYIANTDDRWKAFCDAFGVGKEEYEASDTAEKRRAAAQQVKNIIRKYVSQFTLEEARKKVVDNNIIAGAVVTMKEVLDNDQLKSKLIPLAVVPEVGMTDSPKTIAHLMLPIRSKDYNPEATGNWTPAPKLGQDTVETLRKLGYTEEHIKDLSKREIIWP